MVSNGGSALVAVGRNYPGSRAAVRSTSAFHNHVAFGFLLGFLALVSIILDGGLAKAQANENAWHWEVQRVSGRVAVETRAGEKMIVKRGMTVRKGWKVTTGRGRVAFVRGKEKFVISPNSVVTIEPKGFLVKRTVIYQDRGLVEVDVSRKWYRHFRVETPFLAAVVKGTSFKVRVNRNSASVNVGRGTVNVHDFASGESADVSAGQSASTSPTRRVGLTVAGKTRPEVHAGPKRAPAFNTRIVKNVPASPVRAGIVSGQGRGLGSVSSANSGGNGQSANAGNNGNGNGNSGGNGNGNSGGNGNGNSGGNGNGNSGGNGNGNSGGNGNGNSGGNGNGNSGGNGNGNSGGNGNGNSGGNGNGNSGGNGNGNGRN